MQRGVIGFYLYLCGLAIFKLWLMSPIAIFGETQAGHDDKLFVKLGHAFSQFNWLGEYNELTLIKGPAYPIWLALLHWINMPLLIGQTLIYIIAAFIFTLAIKRIIGSLWLAALFYTVLILNIDLLHRIIREGLYVPLTLLIFALIALLYTQLTLKDKFSGASLLIFGCVLSVFWLTREEGIWIMPSLLLCFVYFAYLVYKQHPIKRDMYKQMLLLFVPFIILFISLQAVSTINGVIYQSWNVIEMKSDAFRGAYGSLSRVEPDKQQQYLPVNKATRARLYTISPAFKELKPHFTRKNFWGYGCPIYPSTCGDIAGGWFMWALREAVAREGYYNNGKTAEAYYLRLKNEIDSACEQRLIACADERNTLMPPIGLNNAENIMHAFVKGLTQLAIPSIYVPSTINSHLIRYGSHGNKKSMRFFSDFVYGPIAPLELTDQHKAYEKRMENKLQLKVLLKIAGFYRMLFTIALTLSSLLFFYLLGKQLFSKKLDFLLVLNSSIFIAILARTLILAIIDATSFPGITQLYMYPLYPLLLVFMMLNFFILSQQINQATVEQKTLSISFKQYTYYFLVGGFVGVLTVLVRELVALFAEDTALYYLFSVLLAYSFGIGISYLLHKSITFKAVLEEVEDSHFNFYKFALVAILGLILTSIFSMLFRYGLNLDSWLHNYAGMIAFIFASLTTSVVTYFLNAKFSISSVVKRDQAAWR